MGSNASKNGAGSKSNSYLLETFYEHTGGINVMALSEDETIMATGSDDKTVKLWSTGNDNCDCIGTLEGHDDIIHCLNIDDRFIWSGGADKTLRKWDLETFKSIGVFRGHKSIVNRILSTGLFVFSSSYDRSARCWDVDTGECLRVFIGHKRGVYPIVFIPEDNDGVDGNRENDTPNSTDARDQENKDVLITGSADYTTIIWSFESGRPKHVLKDHQGAITCLATDPRGKILLTGSTDHTIRSWDIQKGVKLRIFEGHQSAVICLVVSNRMVFSGSSDQTARSWVIEYGDCARIYKGHQHTVSTIKYRDGLLFTGSGDGTAMCFGSKSGTLLRTFKGHEVSVNAIQIANGKLFTGSYDKTMRTWDIGGLKELVIMKRGNVFDENVDDYRTGGDDFESNKNVNHTNDLGDSDQWNDFEA